jgi:hypothetical protein
MTNLEILENVADNHFDDVRPFAAQSLARKVFWSMVKPMYMQPRRAMDDKLVNTAVHAGQCVIRGYKGI